MERPFEAAAPIIQKLLKHNYQAFFVGGSVRDYYLGRTIGDIDIATSATPNDVINLFKKTIPVGIEHGTVVVIHQGLSYEVTTFRTDGTYEDFRHPTTVHFVSSIELDLARRDFTVNAMAMDLSYTVIDPFDGKKDLHQQIIRTVGSPYDRFKEDPLRMMRAIRFVSQLSFDLDKATKKAICDNADLLLNVSIERIAIEFEKTLIGSSRCQGVELLVTTGLYKYLPSFHGYRNELIAFAHKIMSAQLKEPSDFWTILIYMLRVKDLKSLLQKWKRSKQLINACLTKLDALKDVMDKGWENHHLYSLHVDEVLSINKMLCVLQAKQYIEESILLNWYEKLPIKSKRELAVNGNDIMVWTNKAGGPWLKSVIYNLEQAILSGKVKNTKGEIKEWLLGENNN